MLYRLLLALVILMTASIPSRAATKATYSKPGPIHLDKDGEKWAEKTLQKLTTDEKVGQLFMVWVRAQFLNSESADYENLRDEIHKYHVGGFAMTVPVEGGILVRREPSQA